MQTTGLFFPTFFPLFDAKYRNMVCFKKEITMKEDLLKRIVVDPETIAGKPIIRGTRIPVDLILKLLAQGNSTKEILEDYPHLTKEDIQAALLYGAEVIANEDVFPTNVPR